MKRTIGLTLIAGAIVTLATQPVHAAAPVTPTPAVAGAVAAQQGAQATR